ncbi:hypothetical protein B0H14DRAFT_2202298, partial [Mycena olivaceomarginata]
IIFMDSIDSIGSSQGRAGVGGGDSEVQHMMLELLNQLDRLSTVEEYQGYHGDGIESVSPLGAIDILDSALLRPGRIDRKIEFLPPGRTLNIVF